MQITSKFNPIVTQICFRISVLHSLTSSFMVLHSLTFIHVNPLRSINFQSKLHQFNSCLHLLLFFFCSSFNIQFRPSFLIFFLLHFFTSIHFNLPPQYVQNNLKPPVDRHQITSNRNQIPLVHHVNGFKHELEAWA